MDVEMYFVFIGKGCSGDCDDEISGLWLVTIISLLCLWCVALFSLVNK